MEMYNLFLLSPPGFMCDFSTCDYHAMSYREIYCLWVIRYLFYYIYIYLFKNILIYDQYFTVRRRDWEKERERCNSGIWPIFIGEKHQVQPRQISKAGTSPRTFGRLRADLGGGQRRWYREVASYGANRHISLSRRVPGRSLVHTATGHVSAVSVNGNHIP
jgi:hypothetical protein